MKETLDYENKNIEVIELEREDYNYILFQDIETEDLYLSILLNVSSSLYTKTVKLTEEDKVNYSLKTISIKNIVNQYM